jgi:hypothetical protein
MTPLEIERDRIKDEYIKMLGNEIDSLVGLAYMHGWQSKNIQKGIDLRAKIKSLTEQIEAEVDQPKECLNGVHIKGCGYLAPTLRQKITTEQIEKETDGKGKGRCTMIDLYGTKECPVVKSCSECEYFESPSEQPETLTKNKILRNVFHAGFMACKGGMTEKQAKKWANNTYPDKVKLSD